MEQQNLFTPVPKHRLEIFSKEELIEFIQAQQQVNETIIRDNERLRALNEELKQKTLLINDQYIILKNKFFGKSSEKEPTQKDQTDTNKKQKKMKVQLPSLRYPNAPLIERDVELQEIPKCHCGRQMVDLGITEDSEYITVIPAQYMIIRQKRHKYGCDRHHDEIITAPAPQRIKSGSSYSDEMIIDTAMSKYCDLIPVERKAAMAKRESFMDLPPHSLIESTHYLADFVIGAYDRVKYEIIAARVLHADETPHRMLEDNDGKSWYLWGFSTPHSSYFEIRNTRSGDVASELLVDSQCEFLVSDVFSGYGKAVRVTNQTRKERGQIEIRNVYCNAHSRRKFKDASDAFPDEGQYFIDQYKEIYHLESEAKDKPPDKILEIRSQMEPLFKVMQERAMANMRGYSEKSSIGKAMSYFLENYKELTLFITNAEIPIDNNPQERQLRNPVVGRKTWYGTHSKRGAKTAAILFTLVQSCKLNNINPREYFKKLVQDLHDGKNPYSPKEFKDLQK